MYGSLVAPWSIRHVAETGSTNADLLVIAAAGGADRTVLVADHQTAGRGRLDRTWEAPPGTGLLMSMLQRSVPPDGPHRLTQQLAVAAARACERLTAFRPKVKWPNDLLIGEAKLAGILAQVGIVDGRVDHVVIGMGLNLRWAPEGAAKLGDVDRDQLLNAVLDEFDGVVALTDAGVSEYRDRLATLGAPVRVELVGEVVEGTAIDVLSDGRLVVATAAGDRVIDSGDVIHARARR